MAESDLRRCINSGIVRLAVGCLPALPKDQGDKISQQEKQLREAGGGAEFVTTGESLQRIFEPGILAELRGDDLGARVRRTVLEIDVRDDSTVYGSKSDCVWFIDRDAVIFRILLNWARDGGDAAAADSVARTLLHGNDTAVLCDAVENEAAFWGLDVLCNAFKLARVQVATPNGQLSVVNGEHERGAVDAPGAASVVALAARRAMESTHSHTIVRPLDFDFAPSEQTTFSAHDLRRLASEDEHEFEGRSSDDPDVFCYQCHHVIPANEIRRDPVSGGITPLCLSCNDINRLKREQTCSLAGRFAIVTGGRVKIGYAVMCKLLRCGATVLVTTRFPADLLQRFRGEQDYFALKDRLTVFQLDLSHLPSVLSFVTRVQENYTSVDILINNAAQTIRRPPAFYRHLVDAEKALEKAPRDGCGRVNVDGVCVVIGHDTGPSEQLSLAESTNSLNIAPLFATAGQPALGRLCALPTDVDRDDLHFPPGKVDSDGQQLDLRTTNSWAQLVQDVSPVELLEVQLVNVFAPFVLLSQLHSLLVKNSAERPSFVVNVTSAEGNFQGFKAPIHPHTNIAKAAVNQMVRTCALDLARRNVFLNAIDTGWISKLAPSPLQVVSRVAPLTSEDGAARILDPIFSNIINGSAIWGQLLRNFRPAPW